MNDILKNLGVSKADVFLFDLGISYDQLSLSGRFYSCVFVFSENSIFNKSKYKNPLNPAKAGQKLKSERKRFY